MKTATKTALGVVGAVALLIGIWFAVTQWQRLTADYRGETELIERTEANAEFRRQAYDHFFDLCAAVQTDEARIDALTDELETASESRATQINASLSAITTSRAGKINQYNADASKDWTIGQFQANSLPFQLDVNQESTTCAL